MRGRLLFLAVLGLTGILIACSAIAQDWPASSNETSFVHRLDQLGRKIMNGVLPNERSTHSQVAHPRPTTRPSSTDPVPVQSRSPRVGSVVRPDSRQVESTPTPEDPLSLFLRDKYLPPGASPGDGVTPGLPQQPGPPPGFRSAARPPETAGPANWRLHQRLRHFSQSAFAEPPAWESDGSGSVATDVPVGTPGEAAVAGPPTTDSPAAASPPTPAPAQEAAAASPPTPAPPQQAAGRPHVAGQPAESQPAQPLDKGRDPVPSWLVPGARPPKGFVVRRPAPGPAPAGRPTVEPPTSIPATPPPASHADASDTDQSAKPAKSESLLFARQSPVLAVETLGPRRITVGKESTYRVTIRNSGAVAADQVVVTIDLPAWTETVVDRQSQGTAATTPSETEAGGVRWQVGRLDAKGEATLTLRILPRESRPFDLAVKWDYTPAVSQAMIEVQEPKLDMRLEGPREVLYGESRVYRLELANSGTGDAERVEISLVPIGPGENVPAVHKLGTLKAGQKKLIEVELTARQEGILTIQVDARSESGAEAHLAQKITVYRPALEMTVDAPEMQFVGTEATYRIRVSNPGTAAAGNVAVTATIPPEAQYVSNVGEGQVSSDQTKVTWTLNDLDLRAEEILELTCRLTRTGANRLEVACSAAGGLSASAAAAIQVEAIADLSLDVSDPAGPVPVGGEATYQVRIQNRGTKSAENVDVVAYFSQGVEPTSVDGGRHRTGPGQVLFDTIPSIAAGQEISFRIRVKAATPGNHICRVEVYCKPLETKLVSEETTRFYGSTRISQRNSRPAAEAEDASAKNGAVRTADRRRPTLAPQERK